MMMAEIDIYGVYVPALLVWGALTFCLVRLLSFLLSRFSLRPFVWHLPLFNLAVFTILLGAVVALASLPFSG